MLLAFVELLFCAAQSRAGGFEVVAERFPTAVVPILSFLRMDAEEKQRGIVHAAGKPCLERIAPELLCLGSFGEDFRATRQRDITPGRVLANDEHGVVLLNLAHLWAAALGEKPDVAVWLDGRDSHGPGVGEVSAVRHEQIGRTSCR